MKDSLEALESLSNARWYNKWLIRHFSKYLNGEILEVGCGIGNFSRLLSQFGKVHATDINRDYLRRIKKELKSQGNNHITVGFGDIEKKQFPFKPGRKFHSIVCLNKNLLTLQILLQPK